MPKCTSGCYENKGYPRQFVFRDDLYVFKCSGATRMVYDNTCDPSLIAKVMPGRRSGLWQPDWVQNKTEANTLRALEGLPFAPRLVAHEEDFAFVNKWDTFDYMDIIVVDRLGSDLQQAANEVSFRDFVAAYSSGLWAIGMMAKQGIVVPDPHPYNCALIAGSSRLALPCDFGEATTATVATLKKSVKNLFAGFAHMASTAYCVDVGSLMNEVGHHVAGIECPPSDEWIKRGCSFSGW